MAQNEYLVDGADMTTVADAIRAKGGTTAPLSFSAFRQISQTAKKKNTVQTAAYGFSRETAL